MIALFGYGDDPCIAAVARSATELGLDFVLIDQRLAGDIDLVLDVHSGCVMGTVTVAGASCHLADIVGAYARPLSPVRVSDPRADERSRMLHKAFVEWLEVADATVVNRPSAMLSNASKPFQAQLIADAGLRVPATLITNDPDEARDFWRLHGDVVYKSTSGIRSIVRRLELASNDRLDRLRHLPTQFQELIEGVDVRVHVVGEQVFATEVRSDAVDYRYARQDRLTTALADTSLPDEVAELCLGVAAALALPFCGIDLRRRPDDTYVCFEVNPMPGFSYYESHTGQPIGRAVSELLADKAR